MYQHIKQRVSSAFSDLIFDPVKHLYYVDGKNYISVSKKVESHAPKFNAEAILPFSAAKASRTEGRVVTTHELRHKWQTINKTACDLGHETHDFMEHFTGIETPTTPQEKAGVDFYFSMIEDYDILFRENRMYSREFKFAGTDDLLLIHRRTGDVVIADYKTNADLFKNYKGECLFSPFDTMFNTPFNKYQIQLSYYQIMLEEIGCIISDRILVYLKADGTYRLFNLIDFTKELKQLMVNHS